jgi:hypothetical protein
MRNTFWRGKWELDRLAVIALSVAMLAAAALLLLETRGLTILIDEWTWGFGSRTNFDLHSFVDPHNGHFVAVMVLITKAALQIFHADAAVPLRLLAVLLHLAVAGCLFVLLRRAIGAVGALLPTVLFLFLGAANDGIVGSHGMSVTITVLCGLGAWLALLRNSGGWDVFAAALLTIGVATESTTIPFVLAAAVIIATDAGSKRSRYWVVVLPLGVYALWWLAWGHNGEGNVAIANFAALPAFAFDSLAATLASVTGVFTVPGSRTVGFDLSAGQALAGGLLAVTLGLFLSRGYRPGAASVVPMVALLSFWLFTAGVADPGRVPYASRYLYIDVVLILLIFAQEIASSSVQRRGVLVLAGVCGLALLPNIRELTYAGDASRVGAEINRAVMGAADLISGEGDSAALLEEPNDIVAGQVADMSFPLAQFEASRARFGAPALSLPQIEAAGSNARAAADHFLVRALAVGTVPARSGPSALPLPVGAVQSGGSLRRAHGCIRFAPLTVGALLSLRIPPDGLWVRPAAGPPVPIAVARFADLSTIDSGVKVGPVLGGRPSLLRLSPSAASSNWRALLMPDQPLLLCGP